MRGWGAWTATTSFSNQRTIVLLLSLWLFRVELADTSVVMVSALDRTKRALVTLLRQLAVVYSVSLSLTRDSAFDASRQINIVAACPFKD